MCAGGSVVPRVGVQLRRRARRGVVPDGRTMAAPACPSPLGVRSTAGALASAASEGAGGQVSRQLQLGKRSPAGAGLAPLGGLSEGLGSLGWWLENGSWAPASLSPEAVASVRRRWQSPGTLWDCCQRSNHSDHQREESREGACLSSLMRARGGGGADCAPQLPGVDGTVLGTRAAPAGHCVLPAVRGAWGPTGTHCIEGRKPVGKRPASPSLPGQS